MPRRLSCCYFYCINNAKCKNDMSIHNDKQEYVFFIIYIYFFLNHLIHKQYGDREVNHVAEKMSTYINCW